MFVRSQFGVLQQPAETCISYLANEWAPGWTPSSYQNPVQVVLDRVNTLPDSPLRREMAAALHGRMNVGNGVTFAP